MDKCDGKWSEFRKRLAEFRNTPNETGRSPDQMFFARRLRSSVPCLPGMLDLDVENAIEGAARRKVIRQLQYEKRGGVKLRPLDIGQRVLIQDIKKIGRKQKWAKNGKIVAIHHKGENDQALTA